MICGVALMAGQAFAADAPSAVSEVIVTGSRIAGATNLNSPSPITVATHEDIVLSAATTVEDVVGKLPSVDFNGGTSMASNNGGGGVSFIGLRNLGPSRTLVLLDGQRLIPNGAAVDFNVIPLAMVEHVEVLKGGASSVYGADAIGGVINLITRKHADGITFDANYGQSGHGDGQTYGVSSTIGVNSDRSNVMIGLSWDHRNPVQQANRDWAVDTHGNDPHYPGGSAYRTQLDVLQNENNTRQIWIKGQQITNNAANAAFITANVPCTAYIPALTKVKLNAGCENWNYLTSGLDRKQLSVLGHYDITDNLTFVADGFYTDYGATQSLRPEPLLGDTIASSVNGVPIFNGFILPTNYPGNTTGGPLAAYLTPLQFGPRRYEQSTQTYRMRAGLEGKFLDDWKWELGGVEQHIHSTAVVHNEGNFFHLAQITGQVPCIDVPGGCTNGVPNSPPNFFNGPNMFTPAEVKYLTFDNTTISNSRERYFYGDANGTILTLPAGPLKAAVGFETRDEHFDNLPDTLVQQGFAPNPQLPTAGGYSVSSIYGELQIPVLKDLPFVESLDLSPSVRFDDYSNFGGETTYKVGLNYAVTQDLRFRAAYATAIRAPTTTELFGGSVISDNGASGDPCETNQALATGNGNVGRGVLTAGSTCSRAVARGGPVTTFTDVLDQIPSNQLQVLQGGSTTLMPEKAKTFTIGAIITPRWVPGLKLAIDYYDITIDNTILTGGIAGNQGADFILLGCYGPQQNAAYCSQITRDAQGNIIQINSLNTNVGVAKARGIDYELSYDTLAANLSLPIPGSFVFDLQLNQQIKNTQGNPDGSVTDFNGFFNTNNETTQPKIKAVGTIDYALGEWKARWTTRYDQHTADLNGGPGGNGDSVPDLWYNDVSLSYEIKDFRAAKSARVIVGVNNLFDKNPPFIGTDSICKCNTIAGPFDVVGRYFYTRLSATF
jgi:iron complex outermembrane receptor protein